MAQTIDTKALSFRVQKYLDSSQEKINKSMQQMSSGLRINSATDDAAGLAISERMSSQVRGMNVGIRNAYDGISLSRTAEGGLEQVNKLLQSMRELALQSTNGTNSSAERGNLNAEFSALSSEISRIVSTTEFNGDTVLDNNGKSVEYQLGSDIAGEDALTVDLVEVKPPSGNISSMTASLDSITEIDDLIAEVTSARADFGAMQSRFDAAIRDLQAGVETNSAARGRIMDADFAMETAAWTRSRMMEQAGMAMSLQANVLPQNAMMLLK